MGLFDFLGGVGTVAAPGLEAYGKGQLDIANLIASLQNKRQERNFELAKLAEESRQFGVTSNLGQAQLGALIRHQLATEETARKKAEKVDPITLLLMQSRPDLFGQTSLPATKTKKDEGPRILDKVWGEVKGLVSGGAEAGPAVPIVPTTSTSAPTTLPTEPTGLKSGMTFPQWEQKVLPEILKLPGVRAEDAIREVKTEFSHITDDDIKSRFSEMISAGSPQKGEVGMGTASFTEMNRPKGLADRLVEGITYPSRRLERRTGYTIPSRTLGSTPGRGDVGIGPKTGTRNPFFYNR